MGIQALHVDAETILYHSGPPLDLGPLPSLWYFALSGPDSLGLDPYNQPVQFLRGQMIRIFSLTLPAHEEGLDPTMAMSIWAEEFIQGKDPLRPFLDQCQRAVNFAVENRFADPGKLSVAGLSRGGLIAFHLAARDARFQKILGFAPVTALSAVKEFKGITTPYDASSLKTALADRAVRLYIGNRDTRVGTQSAWEFAMSLVDAANKSSPPVELILSPSIGRDGHGTSPATFQSGVQWIFSS